MNELTLSATLENVPLVTEFVDEQLKTWGCSPKVQMQIDIAIDEIFSNIANYAYNPETGPATVRVSVNGEPLTVTITFIDQGVPWKTRTRISVWPQRNGRSVGWAYLW